MKDFYIPLEADAAQVMRLCIAAHHSRPLTSLRWRVEDHSWTRPLTDDSQGDGQDSDSESQKPNPGSEKMTIQDVALDASLDLLSSTSEQTPYVVDERLLFADRLYYRRVIEPDTDDPDSPNAPANARWDQQLEVSNDEDDAWDLRDLTKVYYKHPEQDLEDIAERLAASPSQSKIRLELAADEQLANGDTGCRLNVIYPDYDSWIFPDEEKESDTRAAMRFPVTMRFLISRNTGYLHQVDLANEFVGAQELFGMRHRMVYYGHGRPVHISAPPPEETNALLAPEMVTVSRVITRRVVQFFRAQNEAGTKVKYTMTNSGQPDSLEPEIPILKVGARVLLRSAPAEEPGKPESVITYRERDSDSASWQSSIADHHEEVLEADELALTIFEVEGVYYNWLFSIVFADGHIETVRAYVRSSTAPVVTGERLMAYVREAPDFKEFVALRRGTQTVWNLDFFDDGLSDEDQAETDDDDEDGEEDE